MNSNNPVDPASLHNAPANFLNRRQFLQRTGCGFGMLGLSGLLGEAGLLASSGRAMGNTVPAPDASAVLPHFAGKAKRVIWLFNHGGPSTIDLFDPKPELARCDGKTMNMGKNVGFFSSEGTLMKSPFNFARHGQTGAWVSDAFPNLAKCVDEMAFIRSVTSESNNHGPALYQMNTGMTRVGFPSVGSWVTYGLGTENQDLPGFVVMLDYRGALEGGPYSWGSGFLPSSFQGTPFRASGDSPLLDLSPPQGMDRRIQRKQLDLVAQLNQQHLEAHPAEADLLGRIKSYELAYRMQMRAPDAIDISREDDRTKAMYGIDKPVSRYYGTQLLMARRLVERGVRFVQVYSGAHEDSLRWDAHADLKKNHGDRCAETDLPTAGLLMDLRQRGLLEDTLVVWGAEFGRLPITQGQSTGRDHNRYGFCHWMAGAGVKAGASYGETDEIGFKAAVNPVSVHDVHATILHQLGLDHTKLTYRRNGRDYRLTDTSGRVIQEILA